MHQLVKLIILISALAIASTACKRNDRRSGKTVRANGARQSQKPQQKPQQDPQQREDRDHQTPAPGPVGDKATGNTAGNDTATNKPGAPNPNPSPDTQNRDNCGPKWTGNSDWNPGLPQEPSNVRMCTGGTVGKIDFQQIQKCDAANGALFTDFSNDGMMGSAVEQFNQQGEAMQNGSRELAKNIRDFQLPLGRGGFQSAKLVLRVGNREYETFDLRATRRGRSGEIILDAMNSPRGLKFSAVVKCADRSCQKSVIRIQQHGRSGKVRRVAFMIYRSGEARLTMADNDRFNSKGNRLMEYLAHIANSSCRSERGAENVIFRSWAVTYGQSQFEIALVDRGEVNFSVKGPLLISRSRPVSPTALKVSGALSQYIEGVYLFNNDGGGNINLDIRFKNTRARVSVTTLVKDL